MTGSPYGIRQWEQKLEARRARRERPHVADSAGLLIATLIALGLAALLAAVTR